MSAPRYRAAAAGTLRVVPVEPLVAIYHRASAQTHLVASPVPEILDALADRWLTAEALLTRLDERFDMPDADAAALAARLDELVATGLVERA